jgi:hypothetical protein
MRTDELKSRICSMFCGAIDIAPLASGYAISSPFEDRSGDRIDCFLTPDGDGFRLQDDGSYLAELIARDIAIDQGKRGQLLDGILSQAKAYWNRDTYEIETECFSEADAARRIIDFISAMIRVHDLELITREMVRSTFREDAINALARSFGGIAEFLEDQPISADLQDYPVDLIIKPTRAQPQAILGALYFVNSNDKLNEALLLQTEARLQNLEDFRVIAMLEEPNMKAISGKRFQRAQNRSLAMPIFRGDEHAAMDLVARRLNLKLPHHAGFA